MQYLVAVNVRRVELRREMVHALEILLLLVIIWDLWRVEETGIVCMDTRASIIIAWKHILLVRIVHA
jgi:hypothetical protein